MALWFVIGYAALYWLLAGRTRGSTYERVARISSRRVGEIRLAMRDAFGPGAVWDDASQETEDGEPPDIWCRISRLERMRLIELVQSVDPEARIVFYS